MGLVSGFSGGVLGGLAAMPGPLVFTFLLAKGLRGRTFTKEASMLPVAVGVIGQRLSDNIRAVMFRRLVLIIVLASGLELIRKSLCS